MGALAALGAAVLPFLRMLPWIGPRLQMAGFAVLALVMSHAAVAGYVGFKMHEAKVAEIAAIDAQWRLALRKEKDAYDEKIAAAVDHAMQELPTPADAAQRRVLCRKSPTCRDGGR